MKIIVWNMNYWENTQKRLCDIIEWKNRCIEFMKNEENVDFYILQEINPIKLFEKNFNQYEFSMSDYNILYHELKSELLYDGIRDNFWGNAILFHKKYKLTNKNGMIDFSDKHKNYYSRNSIMCYEFKLNKNESFIIINFYNKINYANKAEYVRTEFEKDKDVINILNESNNRLILAGDFNTGFKIHNKAEYEKFVGIYDKYNLKDCINNYSEKFIPTSYYLRNNDFYLNDFCFFKNFYEIELLNKKEEWENIGKNKLWKGLSDHRPLIFKLDFDKNKPNFA